MEIVISSVQYYAEFCAKFCSKILVYKLKEGPVLAKNALLRSLINESFIEVQLNKITTATFDLLQLEKSVEFLLNLRSAVIIENDYRYTSMNFSCSK